MENPAAEIARRLASQAEAVCRRYLSRGRREGRYWLVGDLRNTPGRSLYVRLTPSPDGRGAAGKWTDGATGEHGDLLDIIASAEGHGRLSETLAEARRFLSLPLPERQTDPRERPCRPSALAGTTEAARRLFAAARPIASTCVERYLRHRQLVDVNDCGALRFHPRCYYRPCADDSPAVRTAWPAMVAAVTDLDGLITGVHRTWLEPATSEKAPVATPRRAMGQLLGNGVRFGVAGEVMAAGEGIETMLSLQSILPQMPMVAGLSAAHLAAIRFPSALRRLYVALDDDPAGSAALALLVQRSIGQNVEIVPLFPSVGDFNDDLRLLGHAAVRDAAGAQLIAEDVVRYLVRAR